MNFFSSQPSPYDLRFRLFGFPIRISPWFWIVSAIMGADGSAQRMIIWIVAVFIGILVHELGHALAMRFYGFEPAITFYAMGGLTSSNAQYQINRRFLSNWEYVIIDAAGPLAGFALFGIIAALLYFIGGYDPLHFMFYGLNEQQSILSFLSAPVQIFLQMELYICLFWGVINLMPVLPLDGGQISREICTAINPQTGIITALKISLITAIILAVCSVVFLNSMFMAAFFGMFAYSSWQTMNSGW